MYKGLARYILILISALLCTNTYSQKLVGGSTENLVLNTWLKEILSLTKNCVGFSPPVAARAFAYYSIGLHEASVGLDREVVSFSNQLNGYTRLNYPETEKEYDLCQVLNFAAYDMATLLYENMPNENAQRIVFVMDSITKKLRHGKSNAVLSNSKEYANRVTAEVFEWSKSDGGHLGFTKNFPTSYNSPACESCWTRTPPSFLPALQPYWGKNRFILESNAHLSLQITPLEFSIDTASQIYKNCMEILLLTKQRNREQEIIAEYWDDSPGYSGTPPGHLYSVTMQLAKLQKLSFPQTIRLYAMLGIALNDAFILCWQLKYHYNFLRPITYIQRYIDPSHNSFIPSPSFPEFPSGHSFQSGAGESVLLAFFENEGGFIDSTQISRTDIDGTPRRFESITSMVNEISISRMYGGIHYRYTLEESLLYGKALGSNVVQRLGVKK